jgi:hypothetical protein
MIHSDLLFERVSGKARRFFRSIRLEQDFFDLDSLQGYTLTPQVRQILVRVEEGIRPDGTERAFTLTGPYGSGKSMFALFLAHLLQAPTKRGNPAFELLREHDPVQAERLVENSLARLAPIVLTLRRAPLAMALLEGLLQATRRLPGSSARNLTQMLEVDLRADIRDTRRILECVEIFRSLVAEGGAHQGVLLVLDELGKSLEYATRHTGEDIYLLQELAETASRSGEKPFLVVGVLHQSFEQYGEHLDFAARKEWAKVQGRFSDITFLEPPEQQMRLAAQAAASLQTKDLKDEQAQLARIAQAMVKAGYSPRGLKPKEFVTLAAEAYPLHPTVLVALPYLFRRFALYN